MKWVSERRFLHFIEDIKTIFARKDEVPKSASDVGADTAGTAESKVSVHNTATDSHNDIRELISGLTQRLNALADSDDTTLDQMSEVVAYIKSNKSLIDAITTSKVSVTDIIDNLTTNVANKPLSAAQGVALKALIDAITTVELDETLTDNTKAAPADVVGKLKGDLEGVNKFVKDFGGSLTETITSESNKLYNLYKNSAFQSEFRNLENVTIVGFLNDIYITSISDVITFVACDNLCFKNLTFSKCLLFYSCSNISFVNCKFSAETENGVTFITPSTIGNAENISFENCKFENCHRMGLEFVNHNNDLVDRYKNISVKNCIFKNNNLGGEPGIKIHCSFSGYGNGLTVSDCTFISDNQSYDEEYGLEILGCKNTNVHDCVFIGNQNIVNAVSDKYPTENIIIQNCTSKKGIGKIHVSAVKRLFISEVFVTSLCVYDTEYSVINNCVIFDDDLINQPLVFQGVYNGVISNIDVYYKYSNGYPAAVLKSSAKNIINNINLNGSSLAFLQINEDSTDNIYDNIVNNNGKKYPSNYKKVEVNQGEIKRISCSGSSNYYVLYLFTSNKVVNYYANTNMAGNEVFVKEITAIDAVDVSAEGLDIVIANNSPDKTVAILNKITS